MYICTMLINSIHIRKAIQSDREIIRAATLINLNWCGERFSLQDLDNTPSFSHYYRNWPGISDFGFVAELKNNPTGIVWLKYFSRLDPGYGFVNGEIPELSICVFPEYQKQGIGRALTEIAIKEAKSRSIPAISLSVEADNPARSLYTSFGFIPVDPQNDNGTMILKL